MPYTVLILGAGASSPYGFPSGKGLVDRIQQQLGVYHGTQKEYGPHDILEYWRKTVGRERIAEFRDSLRRSGRYSVDAFLERRPEFINIGKAAIASMLMPVEFTDSLFEEHGRTIQGDWYRYLSDRLIADWEDFCSKQDLAVITYNYDRSLEHYLFTALKNTFGKNDEECASAMSKLPVIHLHGCLGYLPWQSQSAKDIRKYERGATLNDLHAAVANIRVIHEMTNIEEDPAFQQAHEQLRKATNVYFLGFGYDQRNLERLRLVECLPHGALVRGTSCGLEPAKVERIEKYLSAVTSRTGGNAHLGFARRPSDVDILEAFRYDPHLHSLGA